MQKLKRSGQKTDFLGSLDQVQQKILESQIFFPKNRFLTLLKKRRPKILLLGYNPSYIREIKREKGKKSYINLSLFAFAKREGKENVKYPFPTFHRFSSSRFFPRHIKNKWEKAKRINREMAFCVPFSKTFNIGHENSNLNYKKKIMV